MENLHKKHSNLVDRIRKEITSHSLYADPTSLREDQKFTCQEYLDDPQVARQKLIDKINNAEKLKIEKKKLHANAIKREYLGNLTGHISVNEINDAQLFKLLKADICPLIPDTLSLFNKSQLSLNARVALLGKDRMIFDTLVLFGKLKPIGDDMDLLNVARNN